jgi:tetraacyldisaccharide 4'-kinase
MQGNGLTRGLLAPLSGLYGLLAGAWHRLYDAGWRNKASFDRFVIGVGNLTVGGTGKTPHVEYLVRLLRPHAEVATLSRGYGRRTRGYRRVGPADTAETVGDEPLQFYQKFGETVVVAVGEERALAIPFLLAEAPDVGVILLDDAFQHRAVRPQLNLLLTDFNRLFFNDSPLPGGRLREPRWGARRADAVLVTKCPADLPEKARKKIEAGVKKYVVSGTPVFFTTFRYGEPVPVNNRPWPAEATPVLVTGLANPDPLEAYVRGRYGLRAHRRFADHHAYSEPDLQKLTAWVQNEAQPGVEGVVLTSEKDAVKLRPLLAAHPVPWAVFYLPIEVEFLAGGGPAFDAWVIAAFRAFMAHSGPSRIFEP